MRHRTWHQSMKFRFTPRNVRREKAYVLGHRFGWLQASLGSSLCHFGAVGLHQLTEPVKGFEFRFTPRHVGREKERAQGQGLV